MAYVWTRVQKAVWSSNPRKPVLITPGRDFLVDEGAYRAAHQGPRECARRMRQIENKSLKLKQKLAGLV